MTADLARKEARFQDLIDWLRNESEKRMSQALGRRDFASCMKNATVKELRDSKRLAEKMAGRKLTSVDTTIESAIASATMQDYIAGKLEVESRQLSRWADELEKRR